jgi:hypothetical protein
MFKYYLPKYDEEFITSKKYKEFNIIVPEREDVPKTPGILMSHQKMIANLMKGFTNIEGLLLVHDMGSGKSCTAIAAVEENLKDNVYGMKQAIILNKGKSIMNNFINELLNKCTTRYISNEKYNKFYKFNTFEIFTRNISSRSDEYIKKNYNNIFLVIDEVHNILNIEGEVYKQLDRFISLIPNKKILLLSGTPVRDSVSDIVPIINLLIKDKIDINFFSKSFFTDSGKEEFKKKIKGKVSYLKTNIPEIRIEYMGTGNLFKIIPLKLLDHQSKSYNNAFKLDQEYGCIYNNSRQASRLVFPDGSYGTKGFEKYVKFSKQYYFSPEMVKDLRKYGNSIEDILKRIKELSINYDFKIRKILEADLKGEKTLIYDDLVKGSGLIVFSLLLKEIKFNKFILLTAETVSPSNLIKLQKMVNDDPFGEKISTILGSKVISEGFTFTDILHEHVVPHWNNTETSQVIARGIRMGSHRKTLEKDSNASVKIYREVVYSDSLENSVDYIMTKTSEEKEVNINAVLNIIKESSITCEAFQKRNKGKCDIVSTGPLIEDNYISQGILDNNIILKIQRIMSEKQILNFQELYDEIYHDISNIQELYRYCLYIISEKKNWTHINGVEIYLKNDKDTLFISNDLTDNKIDHSIYSLMIKPWEPSNINSIYENARNIVFPNQDFYKNKQRFIEFALTVKITNIKADINKVDEILKESKEYWEYNIKDKTAKCWYLFDITKGKLSAMCLDKPKTEYPWQEWKKCSQKIKEEMLFEKDKEEKLFEENIRQKNFTHYGLVNILTDDFCIKKIPDNQNKEDKRFLVSGKRCINWNKNELLDIAGKMDINELNINDSRDYVCQEIRNKMEYLNIIKQDRFCGTQKKRK